jgi:hypothetical protein
MVHNIYMKKLKQSVIEAIGSYVYLLKDPRDGKYFYVGKGKGSRIFSHSNDAEKSQENFENNEHSKKIIRIKEIQQAGLEPETIILRHGLDEKTAFLIESVAIDLLQESQGLDNLVSGHESNEKGITTLEDLMIKYQAEPAVFLEPAILININQKYLDNKNNPEKLYEATSKYWRVDIRRSNSIALACAVYRGIIREIYLVRQWKKAENIYLDRAYFIGEVAPEQIRNLYINKSVEQYTKGNSQNPINYVAEKPRKKGKRSANRFIGTDSDFEIIRKSDI